MPFLSSGDDKKNDEEGAWGWGALGAIGAFCREHFIELVLGWAVVPGDESRRVRVRVRLTRSEGLAVLFGIIFRLFSRLDVYKFNFETTIRSTRAGEVKTEQRSQTSYHTHTPSSLPLPAGKLSARQSSSCLPCRDSSKATRCT